MKRFLIFLTVAIFTAFLATVSMADIMDGLVGYWALDGDAADSSGNGNDGILEGSPGWGSGSPGFGQALSLDGQDDHVLLGTCPALSGPTDFSLSIRVKTTSVGGHVIMQQRNGGYNGEYILNMGSSHNTPMNPGQVYFMVYNGGFQWEIWSSKIVNDGDWHHIAVVREGETGTIYIDGEADGTATGDIKDLDNAISAAIGADIRDNGKYFEGEIDDVLIYNRVLTENEIQQLATSGLSAAVDPAAVDPAAKLTTTWANIKNK